MAGYKSSEPRDSKGEWSKVEGYARKVREHLTGSPETRPMLEVVKGTVMRDRWDREEQSYDVKYNSHNEKEFLRRMEAEQNAALTQKHYGINHPVKAAVGNAASSFARAALRGVGIGARDRTKGK